MIDFEEHRSHLRGVAFRMLGSLAEADDAVQEAWLRLDRADRSDVANPRGWLTTVVARICLDMLRTRASRREEPMETGGDRPSATDAEQELMMTDAVGLALLVVLDKLDPAERLAFVLHDMCNMPFDEIAPLVERTPDATRQLASRARRRVQGSPPPESDLAAQRRTIETFVAALRAADVAGLIQVLAPDVVLRAPDLSAADVRGAETVATHWAKGAKAFAQFAPQMALAVVEGSVGLVMAPKRRLVRALRFTFEGDRIATAEIVADRTRLAALEVAPLGG